MYGCPLSISAIQIFFTFPKYTQSDLRTKPLCIQRSLPIDGIYYRCWKSAAPEATTAKNKPLLQFFGHKWVSRSTEYVSGSEADIWARYLSAKLVCSQQGSSLEVIMSRRPMYFISNGTSAVKPLDITKPFYTATDWSAKLTQADKDWLKLFPIHLSPNNFRAYC